MATKEPRVSRDLSSAGHHITLNTGSWCPEGSYMDNRTCWGSVSRPRVNWSTSGPVSLGNAEKFANAILKAVRLGRSIQEMVREDRKHAKSRRLLRRKLSKSLMMVLYGRHV